MKKFKIKNIIMLPILAAVMLTALSCGKGNIPQQDCLVFPIVLNEELITQLDSVFSDKNTYFQSLQDDTFLKVIDNSQAMSEICQNFDIVLCIDFTTQKIVFGKILVSSVSDKIISKKLFQCDNSDTFYNIYVEHCMECYWALGYLYFWEVYPANINSNITLNLLN